MDGIILSHYQARPMLDARRKGLREIQASPDLGMSLWQVAIGVDGVHFEPGQSLGWVQVELIAKSESACFVIEDDEVRAVQYYSDATNRLYSLYPTAGAPTMLVSGIPMHRIKDTDPFKDTQEKIRAIKPVVGQVLDTTTGLGYTAIQASRTADHVITIELDEAVLKVCRVNPWSQALFDNAKITQLVGDSFDVVAGMDAGSFTRVIHDPPVFSLAGDLYSADFYHELHRVMRNHSRLFHYVGDPESKSGRSITAGVIRRLEQVGFRQVRRAPNAFGVVAEK